MVKIKYVFLVMAFCLFFLGGIVYSKVYQRIEQEISYFQDTPVAHVVLIPSAKKEHRHLSITVLDALGNPVPNEEIMVVDYEVSTTPEGITDISGKRNLISAGTKINYIISGKDIVYERGSRLKDVFPCLRYGGMDIIIIKKRVETKLENNSAIRHGHLFLLLEMYYVYDFLSFLYDESFEILKDFFMIR